MALIRTGKTYVFGPTGAGAGSSTGVVSKSTQRRYGSENEVVGGDGEIFDIIYSGEEEAITETTMGNATTLEMSGIGTGNPTIIRRKIDLSNEDMVRVEEEKLNFKSLGGS
jgi:hypothetical protein